MVRVQNFFNEFNELCKSMFEGKVIENLGNDIFKFKWINQQSSLRGIIYWKNLLIGYESSISIEKNSIQNSTVDIVERVKKS